jgi:tellurite resistance protein TerC
MEAMSVGSPWMWAGFVAFVIVMLALDLGIFNRKDHVIKPAEALRWVAFWVSLALVFGAGVWWRFGAKTGIEFYTGYLVEESLSVDNLFVFVVLFRTLGIPGAYQHRVLFWGITTALVLRATMIIGGVALLNRFHWMIFVFGGFLIFTGIKLIFAKDEEPHPENSGIFRWVRRVMPTTPTFHGHAFFTVENGRRVATPLLVALIFIEISDVVFAVDSIPAVFGITRDPFIVFTSNIFAILGLRSMYFVLAHAVDKFHYLKPGLAIVLLFVGTKMVLADVFHIHALVSLAIIVAVLGTAMIASWQKAKREARDGVKPHEEAA